MCSHDDPLPLLSWSGPAWPVVLGYAGRDSLTPTVGETRLLALYHPLMIARHRDQSLCLGQLGQSLDGRIATASGHSHYINGRAALTHLHGLRALVDAVLVGVGTVAADDPRLTVRLVEGPSPARVVIDPGGRADPGARCFADDGCRRVLVHGGGATPPPGVESLAVEGAAGRLAPAAILEGLAAIGLKRVLVEGGAATLSAFLQAGCLDRLHLMTGPLIIGSGKPGIALAPIADLGGALRPRVRVFPLSGGDCLFDCALHETGA